MFQIYQEKKRSAIGKSLRRAGISLAAGGFLTFLIPSLLFPSLDFFRIRPPAGKVMELVAVVLNAPAVVYCMFQLPSGLRRSDEGLYCYSVGFLFNPFYYALVIFCCWWLAEKMLNRRKIS
jgi:hypothetical protein